MLVYMGNPLSRSPERLGTRPVRVLALATDYDGTLARDGLVAPSALAALERLRASGRRLILVTGRELGDLRTVFDRFELFDRIVAENGAAVLDPASGRLSVLAGPPPDSLLAALRRRDVPFSVGSSIVAMPEGYRSAAIDAIREAGTEMTVAFNRESLMLLPAGHHKGTGLAIALHELDLTPDSVVGIGDAENDHSLLDSCGLAVAVADAVPGLREKADWVTPGGAGEGVEQLVARLLEDDLAGLARAAPRFSAGDR
jgi:hydroxymethylpyrimidine pyrophosphatase-like HAD family hydrolase